MIEESNFSSVVYMNAAEATVWPTVVITRGDKHVVLPCRDVMSPDLSVVDLMAAALHTCQLYDECDDILEWTKIYQLDPGEMNVQDEFRELDAAKWQFRALWGEQAYEKLMMMKAVDQALTAAEPGRG